MGNFYETFDPPFYTLRKGPRWSELYPHAYDRSDAEIIAQVRERFAALHGIDTEEVQVSSDQEHVVLQGVVASDRIRKFLGDVAEMVFGVRAVSNELSVRRQGATS